MTIPHNKPSIIMVGDKYPTPKRKIGHPFFRELALQFVQLGMDVTVIAPCPIYSFSDKSVMIPKTDIYDDNGIRVIQPKFLTLGGRQIGKHINTFALTIKFYTQSVLNSIKSLNSSRPICCYGHFLYPAGYAAQQLANKLNVPSFVSLSESLYEMNRAYPLPQSRQGNDLQGFTGIVTVANFIKEYHITQYNFDPDKIIVYPNAADTKRFFPRNKSDMRRKYNLPQDDFIALFVGHFDYRKGYSRLIDAAQRHPDIKLILLGKGADIAPNNQILFNGAVHHHEMPEWLSVADVFVLPTLGEGSSNAIQEAMACGLPVITSRIKSNTDTFTNDECILIDPLSADELSSALKLLYQGQQLRENYTQKSLDYSKSHNLENRAKTILNWLKKQSQQKLLKHEVFPN